MDFTEDVRDTGAELEGSGNCGSDVGANDGSDSDTLRSSGICS